MSEYTTKRFLEVTENDENFQKECLLPCRSICRFSKEGKCRRTFAYHPLWLEGNCLYFEYGN